MEIAIIGGGLTGLAAGYFLTKNGCRVTIFEKNDFLGGLAGSIKKNNWLWPVEFYVHHFFPSDKEITSLAKEVGISDKIIFLRPKTSTYIKGLISQFDSPLTVLMSKNFNLVEKLRLGLATLYLKFTNRWRGLEDKTAASWLRKKMGEKVYRLLWEPLLIGKFSPKNASKISAAWFWSRVKKRSPRLGYFRGGFQILIDNLTGKITENGGRIILDFEVNKIEEKNHKFKIYGSKKDFQDTFDALIFTAPAPTLPKIFKDLPPGLVNKISQTEILGSIGLTLELEETFFKDNTYWLNINDTSFPFVCIVEQTNFIDRENYGGKHILYVSGYYPQDHPLFKMSNKAILKKFLPYLKKINSNFSLDKDSWYSVRKDWFSQPIIPINYSKILPPIETPIKGLYFATMHHIYPWDRGANYAVELGRKVANKILNQE